MIASALAAAHQFTEEFIRRNTVEREQNKAVIPEIAHLIENLFLDIVLGCKDRLDRLFTDFFKNLILPFVEKIVRIRTFDWI